MSLTSKVIEMERIVGQYTGDGICRCPYSGAGRIFWPDGRVTDHGPCPKCRGVRPSLVVQYDPFLGRNT
jgi:hypothetical protein